MLTISYEIRSKESNLHVLFNNAYGLSITNGAQALTQLLSGVMWPPIDQLGPDNFDLQWFTNVVGTSPLQAVPVSHNHTYPNAGPFLFTKLLLPALISGKDTSPDGHTRIITTSSSAAYLNTIDWDTLKDGPARRKMSTVWLYNQSKFVRRLEWSYRNA